jgi:hypothetical protein
MSAEDRVEYWKRRCHVAERCLGYEKDHNEHTREWANNAFRQERRLAARCTFLYGVALAHGATREELAHGLGAHVVQQFDGVCPFAGPHGCEETGPHEHQIAAYL